MKPVSNFRKAAVTLIIPEFLGPLCVIILSGTFVVIWGFLFSSSIEDLLNSWYASKSFITLPVVSSIFALLDLINSFWILIGIFNFNLASYILWIFFECILLMLFSASIFMCPFISTNIIGELYTFMWTVAAIILLLIYKLYRIRIIYFLIQETQEQKPRRYAI